MRVRCKNSRWNDIDDPELTSGKFYNVIDKNLHIMGIEPCFILIGDSGSEITRPKHIFSVMPDRSFIRVIRQGRKMLVSGKLTRRAS